MLQAVISFVVSHWKLVSFGTLVSIGGYVVSWLSARRQSKLKKYAWKLRDFADEVRRKEPNVKFFTRQGLAAQLGRGAKYITQVLELMEEKGWAAKMEFPVDCWRIGASNLQYEPFPLPKRWL